MKFNNALLIIDPQKDFTTKTGSLYVLNAEQDCARIATLIRTKPSFFDGIFVTLDSHHWNMIFHKHFWEDKNGNPPSDFTIITEQDVRDGNWIVRPAFKRETVLKVLSEMKSNGGYDLVIWPDHCIIGSQGATIDDQIQDALKHWEITTGHHVSYLTKGTYPYTEHYGAFHANVQLDDKKETQIADRFINMMEKFSKIYSCGEARSHCYNSTLEQALNISPTLAHKLVILTDCMSDVVTPGGPDWGTLAQPTFDRAQQMGIPFMKSTEVDFTVKGHLADVINS